MRLYLVLLCIILTTPYAYPSTSISGSVELDEFSFYKIINKFDAALVKFDVAYPYGEKHDIYTALARDARDVDELLIAEVGVKDYGEKDNEALAKKYGAIKDNFPVIKLFIKGTPEPLTFDERRYDFTGDELRVFVRNNTGIYLSLPGCIRELDPLAIDFMKVGEDERREILKKVDDILTKLPEKNQAFGKFYKLVMEKILEKGDDTVAKEHQRIKKIRFSNLTSDDKKKELDMKMNILTTFEFSEKGKPPKEEL